VDESEQVVPVLSERLQLWRYLTVEFAEQYIEIMRLLGGDFIAQERSAAELRAGLASAGFDLTIDEVETRCRSLLDWGNIIVALQNNRVNTIAELRRSRNLYQASKLGARVAREAEGILAAAGGAREVALEVLGTIREQLDRILTAVTGTTPAALGDIAAAVTTVFTTQTAFTDSLRDFYAYLNPVISRYDLVGDEYTMLKTVLINYVQLIFSDVQRHAPQIADRLEQLQPHTRTIIETLNSGAQLDGEGVERSPGRTEADWVYLTGWYTGTGERSGPVALRTATDQALRQLLVNATRMLAGAGAGFSRRDDLIRLAVKFSTATNDDAHRMFADRTGMYSWRHLLLGDNERLPVPATVSWWDSEPVDVPVTLREQGDRTPRGRTSSILDTTMESDLAYQDALEQQRLRRLAVSELVSAGTLDGVTLKRAAQTLLLTQLTRMSATADETGSSENTEAGFTLHREPINGVTTIRFEDGILNIDGYRLTVTPAPGQARAEVAG
jgi:uncharacterized protein (TIGR02677 family)